MIQYLVDSPRMALVFRVYQADRGGGEAGQAQGGDAHALAQDCAAQTQALAPRSLHAPDLPTPTSHALALAGSIAPTQEPAVAGWRESLGWDLRRAKKPTPSGAKFLRVSAYIQALVWAVLDHNNALRHNDRLDHQDAQQHVSAPQACSEQWRARVRLHEPGFLSVLTHLTQDEAPGARVPRRPCARGDIECLTDDLVQAAHLRR